MTMRVLSSISFGFSGLRRCPNEAARTLCKTSQGRLITYCDYPSVADRQEPQVPPAIACDSGSTGRAQDGGTILQNAQEFSADVVDLQMCGWLSGDAVRASR